MHYVFPVSIKMSRKHDRQLGNHSLFTVGLRRGGMEGRRVSGKRRVGVRLGAVC